MKVRKLTGGLLSVSALFFGGCAETAPEVPKATIGVDEIIANAHPTLIKNGESAFVRVLSPKDVIGQNLIKQTGLVNHIYPNGPADDMAPEVGANPFRTTTRVSLGGEKTNYLNNDGACDSYPINGDPSYIGAIAIGGNEKGVTISWPNDSDYVYVCGFQKMEPETDHGVVLFATDRSF